MEALHRRFEIHTSQGGQPGDLGFTLLGLSREHPGRVARLWLRRKQGAGRSVWTRYLDPRVQSHHWEVRLHEERGTGAMTRVDFSLGELERLAASYDFPQQPEGSQALLQAPVEDPIYEQLRAWALQIMDVQEPEPEEEEVVEDGAEVAPEEADEEAQGEQAEEA